MWNKLPRLVRQILIGILIACAAYGIRAAAFYLFPAPTEQVVMVAPTPEPKANADSPFTIARNAEGRPVTEGFHFIDQDGKPFNTADWYDKPIVVGFIFTRCEEVCPAMNVALKRIVGSMDPVRLGDDFRILMVGFDTERDTPASLTQFGGKFTDDFSNYRFVSGDPAEVARFAKELGVSYEAAPQGSVAGWKHYVGMTIVASGKVYKQIFGPAPLPEEILAPVMEAQGKSWTPPSH